MCVEGCESTLHWWPETLGKGFPGTEPSVYRCLWKYLAQMGKVQSVCRGRCVWASGRWGALLYPQGSVCFPSLLTLCLTEPSCPSYPYSTLSFVGCETRPDLIRIVFKGRTISFQREGFLCEHIVRALVDLLPTQRFLALICLLNDGRWQKGDLLKNEVSL